MTYYQLCFTRIGGQGSKDGWQTANESPGLGPDAVSNFARFQNGNIYPPAFDEEDRDHIVRELQVDGSFAYLTTIKYGLKDQTGRPSMFAHSLVFPLDEFVRDPQEVLCVEEGNFAFDLEETKIPPSPLKKSSKFVLGDAMNGLGLSGDQYLALLQCVYFILDRKAKHPLHVICDCSPESIKRILTCVYGGMPFEFRKKISYSTYESQDSTTKTIIFSRPKREANGYFLRLETVENNVLSPAVLKRWEKYSFMKVAPYNPSSNIDGYFQGLERKLSLFGSTHTTSLDFYKIAHDLLLDDVKGAKLATPEELCRRLNEFLSLAVDHPLIDRQIQEVLSKIITSKVGLNEVLAEKLCDKLERTSDQALMATGKKWLDQDEKGREIQDGRYLKLLESSCTSLMDQIDENTDPGPLIQEAKDLLDAILPKRPDLVEKALLTIKKAYWQNFSYESLRIDEESAYHDVMLPENDKSQSVKALFDIFHSFAMGDVARFAKQVKALFSKDNDFFTDEERQVLAKKLKEACLEHHDSYYDTELDVWLVLAFLQSEKEKNPIEFLIDNEIGGMVKHFGRAYPKSKILEKEKAKELFVTCLSDYMLDKPEGYKIAAHALKIIKEDEKRTRREIRDSQEGGSFLKHVFKK